MANQDGEHVIISAHLVDGPRDGGTLRIPGTIKGDGVPRAPHLVWAPLGYGHREAAYAFDSWLEQRSGQLHARYRFDQQRSREHWTVRESADDE